MLEILISLSKYLFVAFSAFMCITGIFSLASRDESLSAYQKIIIILQHITAFSIITASKNEAGEIRETLLFGFIELIFIVSANILLCRLYRSGRRLMWNYVFFISDIGFIMLERLNPSLAHKQIIWFIAAFAAVCILSQLLKLLPRLDRFRYIYFAIGLIFLAAALLFATEYGGSKNWIKIGSFNFQPSEAVKIMFVFYLASVFSAQPKEIKNVKTLIPPTVISAVFILCLVFQKDLGSALIFFMTFAVMLYIASGSLILFAACTAGGALASVAAALIFSHVRTRIEIWLDPWSSISDNGYQIAQSLFAITTHGFSGSGLTKGMAASIPVVERDFIFAAICEEFGVLYGCGLVFIFLLMFAEAIKISLKCVNRFLALLSAGLTGLLLFQTFLIIGGVIKMIPLTGVTVPFVSYGGSSVMTCFAIISVIQWIPSNNPSYKKKEV